MNYDQEIDVLKRQMKSLREQVHMHEEWLDTVNSPIYKRIWFWLQGYKYHTLGRWYNKSKPW